MTLEHAREARGRVRTRATAPPGAADHTDHTAHDRARRPAPSPAGDLLALQGSAGNAAVGGLVQLMASVGASNDPLEREADAVAARLAPRLGRHDADRSTGSPYRGGPAELDTDSDEHDVPGQAWQLPPALQRMSSPGAGAAASAPPSGFRQSLTQVAGGRALPRGVRVPAEHALATDLGEVRVHTGPDAGALAGAIGARAFTAGSDVFFGPGEYEPSTAEGRRVLAHELTHVAQQASGSGAPTTTTVQRIADEDRDALLRRAAQLDYHLLTELAAKVPILRRVNELGDKTEKGTHLANEHLKQLILVSALPVERLDRLLAQAIRTDPDAMRTTLQQGPTHASGAVYGMVDACRAVINDYFRAGAGDLDAGQMSARDLDVLARTYDASDDHSLDGDLTHTETRRKFFGRKQTRTVSHNLEEVIASVRMVATIDLHNTHSPTSLPTIDTEAEERARARIGVVGAGPIGLMAALEARLQGAEVILFEARDASYSRRQVLALDRSTEQKLTKFGVKWELLESETKGQGNLVAVKYLEKALWERADELGIERRVGWSLTGVAREDGSAQTSATFQHQPDAPNDQPKATGKSGAKGKGRSGAKGTGRSSGKRKEKSRGKGKGGAKGRGRRKVKDAAESTTSVEQLDLLVVAAGAGVARANKYTGARIADALDITYEVQKAKDYAAVGLFEPTTEGRAPSSDGTNWAYRFNTPKVTYLLRQIPADLFATFQGPEGREELEAFIMDRARTHFQMGANPALAKSTNASGQPTPNLGVFPIEIQQAKTFVNETLQALVIGDAAATPHPHSGSGFNTGVRSLDALVDVVRAVQSQLRARSDVSEESDDGQERRDNDHEPVSEVSAALRAYDAQIKTITDTMVAKALKILADQHAKYLRAAIDAIEADHAKVPGADPLLLMEVQSIRAEAEAVLAADSEVGVEKKLDVLLQGQERIASIRRHIESERKTVVGR